MARKVGRWLGIMLAAMLVLTAFAQSAAGEPVRFSKRMKGRLLFCPSSQEILVFAGQGQGGMLLCREFGSERTLQIAPKRAQLLPFYEDVSSLTATEWMLHAYAHGRRHGWERAVAERVGDTTGRMAMIVEFEIACKSFLGKVSSAAGPSGYGSAEDLGDVVNELWIDDNSMSNVISKAKNGSDRILAIALLEAYDDFVKEHKNVFAVTPEIAALCQSMLQNLKMEQLENFAEWKQTPNPRQERFRKLYPRARSLWMEAPPADYNALLRVFDRSLQAFADLDEISMLTEPELWGSAMLDALLMTEGSPAGEELEKEFDAGIGDVEKNLQSKQVTEP